MESLARSDYVVQLALPVPAEDKAEIEARLQAVLTQISDCQPGVLTIMPALASSEGEGFVEIRMSWVQVPGTKAREALETVQDVAEAIFELAAIEIPPAMRLIVWPEVVNAAA